MPPPMTTAPARFPLSICGRRLRVTHAAPLNRLREQGRQVDDLELGACGAHAVVEHHGADGACHRQGLRPGAHGFAHALLVDGPASTLLHPHARAARSAAERALAVARDRHSPAGRGGQLAWRLAHVVVAREVARVVVRDRPVAASVFSLPSRTRPARNSVWCTTSYRPPKSAYSLPMVLKQCGQVVTIFPTFASFNVPTFCLAIFWKVYSSPIRRAGSPVHDSRGPRIAKSTPAASSSFAVDIAACFARSSNDGAHPTQNRMSGAGSPGPSTRTPSPSAQCARSDCGLPQGLEARSMSRSIVVASSGKRDSTITRFRRRSTMWSMCSIPTGHSRTHAPHVTQSHTTSSVTAVGTSGRSFGVAAFL